MDCPFCAGKYDQPIYRNKAVIAFWNPDSRHDGHAILALVRHIPSWDDATPAEHQALLQGISHVRRIVRQRRTSLKPVLKLPDRTRRPDMPTGWTDVLIDGDRYTANFVSMYVNVMRREGEKTNVLHTILRGWFGEQAGHPGTRFRVVFKKAGDAYRLEPVVGDEWHQKRSDPGD